jgi:Mn-dependent DtxR family transcriptional regulator
MYIYIYTLTAAKDACGLEAILDDDAVVDMLNGINDPSVTVRG